MHCPNLQFGLNVLAFIIAVSSICISVAADDHHKHNKRQRGYGGGFTGLSITPDGIGFTFQSNNFGIGIAPGTLRSIQQGNFEPTRIRQSGCAPTLSQST